jgi:hypothetical protein
MFILQCNVCVRHKTKEETKKREVWKEDVLRQHFFKKRYIKRKPCGKSSCLGTTGTVHVTVIARLSTFY